MTQGTQGKTPDARPEFIVNQSIVTSMSSARSVLSRPVYRMPPHGNAAVAIHRRASPGLHATVHVGNATCCAASRYWLELLDAIRDAMLWAEQEGGESNNRFL